MKTLASVWILLAMALSGCSSFTARVEPDHAVSKYQRFFVKSNLNDNHSLDSIVANSLKEHSREVEQGPLTMMPQNAQVLVTFNDAWNWDFKYHMIAFSLTLSDARTDKLIAIADFSGPTAMRTSPGEVIGRLVDKLFSTAPSSTPTPFIGAPIPAKPGAKGGRTKDKSPS